MGKWNCCVPGCTNSWRNSPSLPFHRIPVDVDLRAKYDRLVRNDNLKLSSSSTRICGAHFPGNQRAFREQLPSIFPWTKDVVPQRVIVKHDLPLHEQKRRKVEEASEPLQQCLSDIDLHCYTDRSRTEDIPTNNTATNEQNVSLKRQQFLC